MKTKVSLLIALLLSIVSVAQTFTVDNAFTPVAICQDITVALDANGLASVTASDMDGGSVDTCGGDVSIALGAFQTTGSVDENDVLDDVLGNGTQTLVEALEITIPVQGDYRIQSTGFTSENGTFFAILYSQQPVRNSGNFQDRPGFLDDLLIQEDGDVNPSNLIFNLTPGTYFLDFFSGNPNIDATASAYELAVVLDSDTANFSCSEIGDNALTLLVTDQNGDRTSCEAAVTVTGMQEVTTSCPEDIILDCPDVVTYDTNILNSTCGFTEVPSEIPGYAFLGTFGNSTYFSTSFIRDAESYFDRINAAGFELVTINSQEENDAITGFINATTNFDRALIGYNDLDTEGTFVWQSGQPATFENFLDGQPSNSGGNENYVQIRSNGGWNDISGSNSEGRAIIEFHDYTTGPILIQGNPSGAFYDEGTTTLNILYAEDRTGASNTCEFTVTVEENQPPEAICQDITVALDANGLASITASDIDGGSTTCDGDVSIALGAFQTTGSVDENDIQDDITAAGSIFFLDSYEVNIPVDGIYQLTLTERIGSNAAAGLVLYDGLPERNSVFFQDRPEFVGFTLRGVNNSFLGGTENLSLAAGTYFFEVIPFVQGETYEFYETAIVLMDGTANFNCSQQGENGLTLLVTNDDGRRNSCEAVVTVQDITAPQIECLDITVALDENGSAIITATDVLQTATDNCEVVNTSVDSSTFNCATLGENIVTLTATDQDGNETECVATVTVIDAIAPVAICQEVTLQLDADGIASLTAAMIDNGSTDNCGLGSLSVDIDTFNCDSVGVNTVLLTVTDTSGNTSSCSAVVTIEDLIAPDVTCPEDETIVLENGATTFEIPDYFATGEAFAIDNCTDPVATFSQDPEPGTDLEDGTYTVTLCATDGFGNENCCEFQLVVDNPLSVDDAVLANLSVYPNPTTDIITISNPNMIVLTTADLYDVKGRLLKTFNVGASSDFTFDVTSLAKGNYFLRINSENGLAVKSFIKR